ncbi:PAS domain-containing protein [Pedobacter sp. Du54]|uniref:sensor histidine kinase n=1 Tax=Pedobacter anseongensis TaxID=3133439 RepID=UPI0030983C0A
MQRYELFKENKNREISSILNQVEENIEQSLKNNYTVSLTLALTIGEKGEPRNFNSVAEKLIRSNPQLQAVQLVPDGVIKYIYPLKGNEKALNLDLFKSVPETVSEVTKAIKSKKMYYQGPVVLNQGGTGLVGRLPVFINNKFWGFSAIVIKLDTFFKSAGIDNTKYKDYQFRFSKQNSTTKKEEFFLDFEDPSKFQQSKSIVFPDGDWKLYVIYVNRFDVWFQLISTVVFGLSLAILSSYLLTRLIIKQADLQQMFKQQGKLLINTESKFKGIFDNAAIGIARVNSKTGELLEVNKYLCEFLGFTAEELINKKIKTLIHPDDVEEESRLFKLFINGEIRQINDEKRYVSKTGDVKWGSVIITPLWKTGEEPTNHIIILEDSSARKAAAQVLVESQHRIQSLINTIDGIVWESYIEPYESIFISKKVEDILGYSVKQWKSSPTFWIDHLYPEDRDMMVEYLNNNIIKKKQLDAEYRIFAKDGSIVWIRDIVSVIEEHGQPVKLRGIMIDITTQKQAEVALNHSFNLVTEQNKRLLNFSYIVSHNLRSHASNIQGITELIENAASAKERKEMIQLLKTVAENLNETLLNLNNVVNIQSSIDIVLEPLNLNDYIQRTLSTLNAQILNRKVAIINKVNENVLINYNRAYLESILLNLISNAIRYSHADRDPVISLTCFEENGQQVLRVSDNGIGIDLKKYGEKMFGMYQTFNGNADARGYGLFITKNQIEAMGGKIEVESQVNKGTTFKIYFKS